MRYNIDYLFLNRGFFEVRGFVLPDTKGEDIPVTLELKGSAEPYTIERAARPDVTAAFFGEEKTENLPGFYAYGRVDKDAVLVFGGEKPVRISLKQYHDKQFSFLRRLRASDKAAFDRARDEGTEKHPFAVYREMNALRPFVSAEEFRKAFRDANPGYRLFTDNAAAFAPNAADLLGRAIRSNPEASVFFGDGEEWADGHWRPILEPEWDPVRVRRGALPGAVLAVKENFLAEVSASDGERLIPERLADAAKGRAVHLPELLYSYEREDRLPFAVSPADGGPDSGTDPDLPSVTVLIPNRDEPEALGPCVRSLYEKNRRVRIETVILENHSVREETFALYETLKREYGSVRILTYEKPFNYASINNFGAEAAAGDYLLLLNNDTEFRSEEALSEMISVLKSDPSVGIAGAKLLYRDYTLQHAGVIASEEGKIAHYFMNDPEAHGGYRNFANELRTVSAVTGACLMIRTGLYRELGGMDESFAVAYNDIDLCLKAEKQGYASVYQPAAVLYHDESRTRGYEDSPEKVERLNRERAVLMEKWGERLTSDPHVPALASRIRDLDFFTGEEHPTGF